MTDRLKHMKETLMSAVEMELCNLSEADTKELGEAIDMIKDLEETLYYCSIVEAMEEEKEKGKSHYQNGEQSMMYYPVMMNYAKEQEGNTDWRDAPRRYYDGNSGMNYANSGRGNSSGNRSGGNNSSNNNGGNSSSQYTEREMPNNVFADGREGRSPRSRRMYMEAKETHQDKAAQMRELEKYMQELTQDMVEMVEDASPEEKQLLSKRIAALGTKIGQLDD